MHLDIDLTFIIGISAIVFVAIIGGIVAFWPDEARKPKARRTRSPRRYSGGGYSGGSANDDLNPFSPMSPLYSATMSSFD